MTQTLTTKVLNDFITGQGYGVAPSAVEAMARELLANREAQPVEWGSPKTVGQMIGQLKTLDPAMETTALLRMPPDILDGNAVRQVPISISFEKLNGQWLAPYKGEGRKVLAFWAKADHREEGERGDLLTAPPAPAVPEGWEPCSPEWIERNGPCSCGEAPRIAFGPIGNHYHPHLWHKPAVPDESDPRDAFESVFPMPKYVVRCGTGYAVTAYSAWGAHDFKERWEGWNACRAAMLKGERP